MNTRQIIRISILVVALILAVSTGYQTWNTGNVLAASSVAPVGSWIVTVEPEGGPAFVDVVAFHKDSTATIVENGAAGTGVWQKTSADSYTLTLWSLVDPDLEPNWVRAKIVSTIQLSKDGKQYTGPFITYFYDQQGNLLFSAGGTATGVWMSLEAMP